MRIETVEKIITFFAGLAIVLVAGLVTFFSIVPKQSDVSREEVDARLAYDKWLEDARTVANGGTVHKAFEKIDLPSQGGATQGARPAGHPVGAVAGAKGPVAPPAKVDPAKPAQPDNYFDSSCQVPKEEQVGNYSWLRREPGVVYTRPEAVPQVLVEKYQSFDDAYQLAFNEGSGQFVNGHYRIDSLGDQSYLRTKLGLQPGDEVISVNGHPVGNSVGAGQALYGQLKGEKRFAVKILRSGQEMVLSYYLN